MDPVKLQADQIAQKMRHFLISTFGKRSDQASDIELYQALCFVLREELMINWTSSRQALAQKGVRKLYYLSMEYMPGRLLGNTITNMNAQPLVATVLKRFNRTLSSLSQIEPDMGIGNGGLGRLASCFLDALATHHYAAIGYGMRYQYGIFDQELLCGVQIERPDRWLMRGNAWEFRNDEHAVLVHFAGDLIARKNRHGEEVFDLLNPEEVRALPYDCPIIGYSETSHFSVITLRLWSTKESPRNFQLQRYNAGDIGEASENTTLTDVLYPNDNHAAGKRIRLKQEFLLLSASLRDIVNSYRTLYPNFDHFADLVRIQINDTHPAFIVPHLLHLLMKEGDLPFGQAWEMTQSCLAYTNHTVLQEALEEWNQQRVHELLPIEYKMIERLNHHLCEQVRRAFPNDEKRVRQMSIIAGGQVKMAHLAIYGSHHVNGVASLHTRILKERLFHNFYELYPQRFINITNGVTQRKWLLHANPQLSQFLCQRIGRGWITDFTQIAQIAEYAHDEESQQTFWAIKRANKERFLEMFLKEREYIHGQEVGYATLHLHTVDALFDVQIKRIHEYKRQLMMAIHLLMLYLEIKDNPAHHGRIKRLAIFGGKAAPGYKIAKEIIRFIYCLSRKINQDPQVSPILKVIFIENYNVSKAEVIIPGTDLSEQISTAGMEASGTGNMKFAINGALTICTDDGANVEMRQEIQDRWWPFAFGCSAQQNQELIASDSYHPKKLLRQHPKIAQALNSLCDWSLADNQAEHQSLTSIYRCLVEGPPQGDADPFFVLNDLSDYYATQKQVERLYQQPLQWAEHAIHNIAGMGLFSADMSIQNYANKVWDLKPSPPNLELIEQVRKEYSEHDRCRVI